MKDHVVTACFDSDSPLSSPCRLVNGAARSVIERSESSGINQNQPTIRTASLPTVTHNSEPRGRPTEKRSTKRLAKVNILELEYLLFFLEILKSIEREIVRMSPRQSARGNPC